MDVSGAVQAADNAANEAREWETAAAEVFQETGDGRQGTGENLAPDNLEPDWAGVSPALKQAIEGINNRLGTLDALDHRLRSTEGRVGSMQQAFAEQRRVAAEAAQKAAERAASQPTAEEIEKARQSRKAWQSLKDEFPDWGAELEQQFASQGQALAAAHQELAQLRARSAAVGGGNQEEIAKLQKAYDEKLLTIQHPDWKQVINTPEFGQWMSGADAKTRMVFQNSSDPVECIAVIGAYKAAKGGAGNAGAGGDRNRRLAQAAAVPAGGGRGGQQSNPANMSDDEYRAYVARQLWR